MDVPSKFFTLSILSIAILLFNVISFQKVSQLVSSPNLRSTVEWGFYNCPYVTSYENQQPTY